jgi:cell division control protein 24
VLAGTNDAIAREERVEAVEHLKGLVEDWKGHRIEGFGELLLYGQYTVLKGESMTSKNEEREYKIYLFEMILLCCKEINVNKPKNKMSTRTLVTKDGKPKLQLKGRIFMQNVTETISLQKPGMYYIQFTTHILTSQARTHVRSSGKATQVSRTSSYVLRPRPR